MSLRHLSGQLRHRLSQTFGYRRPPSSRSTRSSSSSATAADGASAAALTNAHRAGQGSGGPRGGGRIRPRTAAPSSSRMPRYYLPAPPTSPLDVARFGLLSVATLPFTVWIAYFTYDYVYRVEICQEALGRQDDDLLPSDSSYRRSSSKPVNKSVGC